MNNLKKIFAILFVLAYSKVTGQSNNGIYRSVEEIFPDKKITGRFNFTGLLDVFDENISLGIEYRFKSLWSAGSDVAYIFRSDYLSESNTAGGIILRPFFRYYFNTRGRIFLEAQVHYKYAVYKLTDWVGRDVSNGIPAYEEYTTFRYHKRALGLNINFGDNVNLTRDEKLRLEPYIGLGVRFKKQGVDNGVYARERRLLASIYEPKYSTVVLPLGMRLVYDFK